MEEYVNKHTFAICAYKESDYLEDCIQSVCNQSVKSKVIIVTSTPNQLIDTLAKKYQIPLYINTGKSGIANDWNFAYNKATTPYVTIAHQDDMYEYEYAKTVVQKLEKKEKALICFTNYAEIRNDKKVTDNKLLKIKRLMLLPMRIPGIKNWRFVIRRILSLGNPICCPSVTYVKKNLPNPVFKPGYLSNIDWQAWERMTRIKGTMIYTKQILTYHRIHEDSTTSEIIRDNQRIKEDYEMFCKFWPRFVAKRICHYYAKSEDSNAV